MKKNSYRLVWDRLALKHFKEILSFLSKQSNQAPIIVKSAVLDRLENIRTNPTGYEIDRLKELPDENFRVSIVFSYRIAYQIKAEKKEIRVLRIRHTSREPIGY